MRKIIAGLFITLDGVVEAPEKWNPPYYDVTAALARLKEQPGGDIIVGASGTLVRFLLHEGLLDELRLLVHPVIVGPGRRLFEGDDQNMPLMLTQAQAHRNGVVALRYTLGHGTVAPTLSEVSQCAS
jgi:dihydrofolate reductase